MGVSEVSVVGDGDRPLGIICSDGLAVFYPGASSRCIPYSPGSVLRGPVPYPSLCLLSRPLSMLRRQKADPCAVVRRDRDRHPQVLRHRSCCKRRKRHTFSETALREGLFQFSEIKAEYIFPFKLFSPDSSYVCAGKPFPYLFKRRSFFFGNGIYGSCSAF